MWQTLCSQTCLSGGGAENFLSRKTPSPDDLAALLPHVWWPNTYDETASEERLRASVSMLTATIAKVGPAPHTPRLQRRVGVRAPHS